jgi:hypothetical protein
MVAVVDCAVPHAAEVYLRAPVVVDAAIADVANQQCAVGLSQYTRQGPYTVEPTSKANSLRVLARSY